MERNPDGSPESLADAVTLMKAQIDSPPHVRVNEQGEYNWDDMVILDKWTDEYLTGKLRTALSN